jgi:hypothetical protein
MAIPLCFREIAPKIGIHLLPDYAIDREGSLPFDKEFRSCTCQSLKQKNSQTYISIESLQMVDLWFW